MWGLVWESRCEREKHIAVPLWAQVSHKTDEKRYSIMHIGSIITEKKTAELIQSPAYISLNSTIAAIIRLPQPWVLVVRVAG